MRHGPHGRHAPRARGATTPSTAPDQATQATESGNAGGNAGEHDSPLITAIAWRLRFAHSLTCEVDANGATYSVAARVARASDAELAARVRVVVTAPTALECERLLTAHFRREARLAYAAYVLESMEGSDGPDGLEGSSNE